MAIERLDVWQNRGPTCEFMRSLNMPQPYVAASVAAIDLCDIKKHNDKVNLDNGQ